MGLFWYSQLRTQTLAVQGLRAAYPQDLDAMEALLKPLEEQGILAPRSRTQLIMDLPYFRVSERETKVHMLLVLSGTTCALCVCH